VLDAGVVIGVPCPILHDRESAWTLRVSRWCRDQDGAAAAGAERVGPEAADEQVAAAAALEPIVPRPADQHVVGATPLASRVSLPSPPNRRAGTDRPPRR